MSHSNYPCPCLTYLKGRKELFISAIPGTGQEKNLVVINFMVVVLVPSVCVLTGKVKKLKMEVCFVSKELVKPSSPTPSHLRAFKLCLFDQLMPSPYAPIVLFYETGHIDVIKRLQVLKTSLSETLSSFYPLAGKIKDELSIDCDDEGAYFVETRVSRPLNEFLDQPDLLLLHQFLPCQVTVEPTAGTFVTNIQANVFECGGLAVGICISHKVLDGAALSTFLNGWAATARGSKEAILPSFIASTLFPANDSWLRDSSIFIWSSLLRKGNSITRRFVFDASALAILKDQAASSFVRCPTRVEVVSAFLWKCIMAASEDLHGFQRPSILAHLVNLRRRISSPLSGNSLGNLLWLATAQHMTESRPELKDLVGKVRKGIAKIDDKYVEKMMGDGGESMMSKTLKEIGRLGSKEGVDYINFSSWCNFDYYRTDFGWGSPDWVSSIGLAGSAVMNLVILVDTKMKDGIEAWVTLDEQLMAALEGNAELHKLASLDPSPLAISITTEHT